MYVPQPKKLLIMNILEILRQYSDNDHRLSQKQIQDILEKKYEMKADRKSIKRNLMNLINFGYQLEYTETVRKNKQGEEEIICSDWYLQREFEDSELRLLIDSLLFSKHIPYSQCKELIQKIENQSSQYFRSKVRHVCNLPVDLPVNPELFLTVEVMDEAIEQGLQVEFHYADYGTDKRLHLRLGKDGNPRSYLVNPYQMVATNGRYYLIGNYDKYDNISHYRIDRIKNIRICDSPAKPQRKVVGMEWGLNLPQHMAEHVYMFSGENAPVEFVASKGMAGELIDWFGNQVQFLNEDNEHIRARVTVNLQAMRYWALQYAPYVTVTSPQRLVESIKTDLQSALKRYGNDS